MSLWDHFGHMKVSFGAFRGHFEVTLSMSTSSFMCDACVMHTCTGLVGPKMGKVKIRLVFKAFLNGSKKPRVFQEHERPSENCHFGVTLGSLWSHLGVTSGTFG